MDLVGSWLPALVTVATLAWAGMAVAALAAVYLKK